MRQEANNFLCIPFSSIMNKKVYLYLVIHSDALLLLLYFFVLIFFLVCTCKNHTDFYYLMCRLEFDRVTSIYYLSYIPYGIQ
jgi:hypothetical protein